jgi:hypothetical protein
VEIFVLEQADNSLHTDPIRRGCSGSRRCSLARQLRLVWGSEKGMKQLWRRVVRKGLRPSQHTIQISMHSSHEETQREIDARQII